MEDVYRFLMECDNAQMFTERKFKQEFPIIYDRICSLSFPDFCSTFGQKLYHYLNNDMGFELGVCPVCGGRCKFNNFKSGYRKTCSSKCSNNYGEKIRKQLETYSAHSDEERLAIRSKKMKTNNERYGGSGFASKSLKDKYETTMLEKYGETHNFKVKAIREKRTQTWIDKYGCDNPMKNDEVKRRSVETNSCKGENEKDAIVAKRKQTKLKLYGDENYTNPRKRYETNIERYGVDVASKSSVVRNKLKRNAILRSLDSHDDVIEIHENDYLCKCPHNDCQCCCEKTFMINKHTYNERKLRQCEMCTKLNNPLDNRVSEMEKNICAYISSIYDGELVCNDRTLLNGKEIDVYLPELRLGFEFNGDYWHCNPRLYNADYNDGTKCSKNEWKRTILKEYLANTKDVSLVTLWEYDYKYNKDIVEGIIKSAIKTRPMSPYYKLKSFLDGLGKTYNENETFVFEYDDLVVRYIDCNYYNENTIDGGCFIESESRVIYVYDFEVNDIRKFDVLKSTIRHALGLTINRIFARKCELLEITNKVSKPFLDDNSLFGHRNATITLGLYYGGELVMVYSFGNNYYGKKKHIEVIRVCTKKDTLVVGGSTKCLSYFVKKYGHLLDNNELVFYVDRIHSDGGSLKNFQYIRHYDGVMNYWLDDYVSNTLCGIRGNAFNRNPNKNKEIKEISKNGHIAFIRTKGVDVYYYIKH